VSLFKAIRVGMLLLILVIVAGNHWLGMARLAEWDQPIWITVYPLPADDRPETRRYVDRLDPDAFDEISAFFTREARRFGRELPQAAHFQLAPTPATPPPAIPAEDGRLGIAWWSLKMRWYAWRQGHRDGLPAPDIQVFIRYTAPQGAPRLDRSVGIQKGRYTVVNAYASPRMASRNRVVIAHELLHVLGATDKYDPASGQPVPPHGLANPRARPLYPQSHAEIMAGAIALSPGSHRMPASLARAVVGGLTAREIGWRD